MSNNPAVPASGAPVGPGRALAVPGAPPSVADAAQLRPFPQALGKLHSPQWLYTFIAAEFAFQLLIITPWGERARVLVRTGAFAVSFLLLFVLRSSQVAHPSWKMAFVAMAIVVASIFHPDTNGAWAGCATAFLHLAVVAPIFWVPRIRVDLTTVRRVFVLLWTFNTASAVLGALQVYFPGQFQPAISSSMDEGYLHGLSFRLANGMEVLRPMGLTTQPGGASIGAMYTVLLGVALLLDRPRTWVRAVVIPGMVLALFTLFLSQVRVFVVMTAISLIALSVPFIAQRRVGRFVSFAVLISTVALVGFFFAVLIGGDSVTDRLGTLIEGDPATVYNNSRGVFLRHTFLELVPEFPLGAGLGRWGMVCAYFSDNSSPGLWAEIQWTGWLYDGGVPMILAYAVALLTALRVSLGIASGRGASPELQKWAAAVFAYSVGAIAITFSAVSFASTLGIDFWVFNATLFAASHQAMRPHSGC